MKVRIACFFAILFASASSAAAGQQINSERAASALSDAAEVCSKDGGALWGVSMCAPIALIQRQTRLVIANDTVSGQPYYKVGDNLFVTTAPPGTGFANTSFKWADRQWAMIMLPLPKDRFDRVALVMHEVFHSKQHELGLDGADPPNNQLDQKDGRIWLRFELEALAAALESLPDKTAAAKKVNDALLFRAQRRALYPLADSLEPLLEIQEGLAEYTGEKMAMLLTGEGPARVATTVRAFHSNPAYVRSFAYGTGPALGVLLDEFAPGWKSEIRQRHDPAGILAARVKFVAPRQLAREAEKRSKAYAADVILAAENERDSKRSAEMAAYKSRLVDGPVLTLTQSGGINRMFDPTALIGFDMTNTLYPTGTFGSEWGSIEVTSGGALIANDYSQIRVSAPASVPGVEDRTVRGDGWVLTLKPGWAVYRSANHEGSFEVRKIT